MRDTRLQKRTQESCRARVRGLSVTYPCKAAVSTVSSTALGQPSTFHLHFLPSPLRSALPSQQDSCSSGSLLLDSEWNNRVLLSTGAPQFYCNNNNYWWKPLHYFPKLQVRYPVPCSHSRVSDYSPYWKMLCTFKENYSSVFLLKT